MGHPVPFQPLNTDVGRLKHPITSAGMSPHFKTHDTFETKQKIINYFVIITLFFLLMVQTLFEVT